MPKSVSRDESDAVGNFLLPIFEFFFGEGNVTSHIVRKTAHVTEYFVLGSELTLMIVWGWVFRYKKISDATNCDGALNTTSNWSHAIWLRALISVAVAFAIACIDETIQIFSNRGPGFGDVLIDTAGAAGGVAILTLVRLLALLFLQKKTL